MLEKFIKIENVGRFVNPDCTGDKKRFAKLTIVYGENSRGKSTVAEILRSLSTGKPEPILEKKTTWSANPSFVQLVVDGRVRTFKDGSWKDGTCNFLIFDSTFINDSVYTGHEIGLENRRNLYEFLIGDEVVLMAKEVEALTAQCTAALAPVKEKEKALAALHIGTTLDEFLAIPNDVQIDQKIGAKRQLIEQLKRADEIKRAKELRPLSTEVFSIGEFKELIAKSVQQVSDKSTLILKEHIEKHINADVETAKDWLQQGTEISRNDTCPFCGQDVRDLGIVKAYAEIFNDEYKVFLDALSSCGTKAQTSLSHTAKAVFMEHLEANDASATFWNSILEEKISTELPEVRLSTHFATVRERVTNTLKLKRGDPLNVLSHTAEDEAAFAAYDAEVAKLAIYNESVSLINEGIREHKAALKAEGLAAEQQMLAQLELIKKRHEPATAALCAEYALASASRKTLEKQKDDKRAEVKPKANAILKQHQSTINEYLERFGASFTIVEAEAEIDKGKSSSSFAIELGNKVVQLDSKPGNPCFRSALSDGDKRTLALAVFLSRLHKESNLSTSRILLDDPVTSLDAHRAQHVIEEIKSWLNKAAQMIVVSHQKQFLASLIMRNEITDVRHLKIARKGTDESTFEPWDYDRETENDFFQNFRRLTEFRDGTGGHALLDVAKAIRPVLEGTMKMRFPGTVTVKTMIGETLTMIQKAKADLSSDEAKAGLHLFDPHADELKKLNEFARDYHHDQNGGKAIVEPGESVLLSYVKRTIKFAQGPFS